MHYMVLVMLTNIRLGGKWLALTKALIYNIKEKRYHDTQHNDIHIVTLSIKVLVCRLSLKTFSKMGLLVTLSLKGLFAALSITTLP
jgi:hypothetical protein